MGVYVIGLVGVIAFYVAVLGVGIWAAAVKKKKSRHGHDALILANRGLGPILGVFTLIGKFSNKIHFYTRDMKFKLNSTDCIYSFD